MNKSNTLVIQRAIKLSTHMTSVCLEQAFWIALRDIAETREMRPTDLIRLINTERDLPNLSSAIRVFILDYYRTEAIKAQAFRDVSPAERKQAALPTTPVLR